MQDETEQQKASGTPRSLLRKEELRENELLKEVHHRIRNDLQVIVSLLNLQSSHINDERIRLPFQEMRNRVLAIASIHDSLYSSKSFARVGLLDYAKHVVPGVVSFYSLENRVRLEIGGDSATLEPARAVPFGILLNELISNACKHAFPSPQTGILKVHIEQQPAGADISLIVADTGVGLPGGFEFARVSSLGFKLVRGLVHQLRATIDFQSGPGTTITIRFPGAEDEKEEERDQLN